MSKLHQSWRWSSWPKLQYGGLASFTGFLHVTLKTLILRKKKKNNTHFWGEVGALSEHGHTLMVTMYFRKEIFFKGLGLANAMVPLAVSTCISPYTLVKFWTVSPRQTEQYPTNKSGKLNIFLLRIFTLVLIYLGKSVLDRVRLCKAELKF